MKGRVTVVGGGMGHPSLLTEEARSALAEARRVFVLGRRAGAVEELRPDAVAMTVDEVVPALRGDPGQYAVAVSGDPGFYSLADRLRRELAGWRVESVCGISSLQYLCARLGFPWQDVKTVSLHGREGSLLGPVSYHSRVFVLTGGTGPGELLEELHRQGLGYVRAVVGEDLTGPRERLRTGPVEELYLEEFGAPSVMLLENDSPAPLWGRLRDADFIRGNVPMTKEAVRTLAVERLEVRPADVLWDVGAGTGSVSAGMARAAREGLVYGVERDPEALVLMEKNRRKLGVFNFLPCEAEAPGGLYALPVPDGVFVGGSGGRLREILSHALRRNPRVRLCVTAVTLESLHLAFRSMEELGCNVEAQCLGVTGLKPAGSAHRMEAQNPVWILSGRAR